MSTTQIDAAGAEHPPAGPQARILSLVPSLTELLFALGLGLQVVGRTMYCVHPEDREELERRLKKKKIAGKTITLKIKYKV